MSNSLQVFQFETSTIRTVEIDGVVWFVAGEVSNILGYAQTSNALKHCQKASVLDELNKINGLASATKWIPESDLYRLTMKSTLESAEKFQDWVVEEVLPTIRKTGSYNINTPIVPLLPFTPHEIAVKQFEGECKVAALLNCPKHLAQQEIVKSVRKTTGFDFEFLLKISEDQQNILPQQEMLEPTEIGIRYNLGSGIKVNKILEGFGLQTYINKEWIPTALGAPHCQRHAWAKKNKSGYNLKWDLDFLEKYFNVSNTEEEGEEESDSEE